MAMFPCCTCCTRKKIKVGVILIALLIPICGIIIGISFIVFENYPEEPCDDIINVSVGAQQICKFNQYDSDDGYFECKDDNVEAYQYSSWTYSYLKSVTENRTFKYRESVGAHKFAVYSVKLSSSDKMYFNYELSAAADVFVFNKAQYTAFVNRAKTDDYIYYDPSTTNVVHNVNGQTENSQGMFVVIVNENSFEIDVNESGWVKNTAIQMDRSRAMKVCTGKCTLKEPNYTVVVVTNGGEERTVPIKMLKNYTLNEAIVITIIVCCISAVCTVFPMAFLGFCYCDAPAEGKPAPEGKVDQNATPMDTIATDPNAKEVQAFEGA